MVRKILAFVAGIVVFGALTAAIQIVNMLIFGMPDQKAMSDPEAMKAYIASLPTGAFIGLLLSYAAGSYVAGFIMRKISKWDSLILAALLGLMGTVAWIVNLGQYPHPLWVAALGFLCFIPFTLLGHKTAK